MIKQDQKDRYEFQHTESGKEVVQMLEFMKKQLCTELQIPSSKIKTGKLKALTNEYTGEIERFIEE